MTPFSPPPPDAFDFQPVVRALTLTPDAMAWAVDRCRRQRDRQRRWQTLLQAMALQGVQQWLQAGATELTVELAAEDQLQVNGYRLQVLPVGSLVDDWVERPPGPLPHLCVLAEVLEETNQVTVISGLRGERLQAYCQAQGLDPARCDRLPLAQFDTPPEQLLLYLSCLPAERLQPAATARFPGLTDVSRWFQAQLDTVADELAWLLLPPLTPAAVRGQSAAAAITAILQDIDPQRQVIPLEVRGAHQELTWGHQRLRLYALVWTAPRPPLEWSLMLVVAAPEGTPLPPGLRLQIRDSQALLVDQAFRPETGTAALYAQVLGQWGEVFEAELSLPSGDRLPLPPFTYQPSPEA